MSDDPADIFGIEHPTIQNKVAGRLRTLILTDRLVPGQRLVQDELAAQLGVSRTPVRGALQLLAAEGYVTHISYKGASVAEFSLSELEETYAIRVGLESHAASLAAQRITQEELQQLEDLLPRLESASHETDRMPLLEFNRQFHLAIYAAAKLPRMFDLIVNYFDQAERYRGLFHNAGTHAEDTVAEHREILENLRRADAEGAARLTRLHLQQTASILTERECFPSDGKASWLAAVFNRESGDLHALDHRIASRLQNPG